MHLIVARQSIDLAGQSGPLNTASLDDKYTDKTISSLLRHANTRAIGATLDFDATLADKKSLVGMQACHQAWTPCLAGDCVEQIWTCVEHATAPMNAMEEAWKSLQDAADLEGKRRDVTLLRVSDQSIVFLGSNSLSIVNMRGLLLAAGVLSTAGYVRGHPAPDARPGLARRTVDLNAFRLTALSEYVNATVAESSVDASSLVERADYVDVATALVKDKAPGATFRLVQDHYVGNNGIAHVHFKQTANGLDIDNADFNVNVDREGEVFSFGGSFFEGEIPELSALRRRDVIEPVEALQTASNVLQLSVKADSATAEPTDGDDAFVIKGTTGAQKDPKAQLMYLQTPEGQLVLTWRVETDIESNWLLTYVDASSENEVHGVIDWAADASYSVYPWGLNDPSEGSRQTVVDPFDPSASEFGWHSTGTNSYTTTRGNNAIAQTNPSGGNSYLNNYRPTNAQQNFIYPYTTSMTPPTSYVDASVTQLFYVSNVYHDLLHILGFNEAAGNFEVNNNGAGGRGNDEVILNTQDGSGTNNANFATPPDGQNPRMRMFIWTYSTPRRDSSFDAGVIIHEYTHGLSTRLTGGPANSNCLNALESGGMGEGWGDFMATAIRLKAADTRSKNYGMGDWIANDPSGIRAYPYSTSLTTNPLTYASVNGMTIVHSIGTVWATMLYEVMWNLIDKLGKNNAAKPTLRNGVATDGRYLAMQLVMDGMALQPCNPNFVQARDAIIDADRALTGGSNACAIWSGFAKRGLGSGAVYSSSRRTASTAIPSGVC
ncbi:hypothetical protein Q7P37_006108 [Cladosporium fusiforme]